MLFKGRDTDARDVAFQVNDSAANTVDNKVSKVGEQVMWIRALVEYVLSFKVKLVF